jgi:AraC-like DNA-binding protein
MHTGTAYLHETPIIQKAGVHQAGRGEDFPFHRDQYWELMYVRQGHIACHQEESRYSLHSGMAILHPAEALHADFAQSAYTTYYLWLDLPSEGSIKDWPRVCYDDASHRLERICGDIVWEWNHRFERTDRAADRMLSLLAEQLEIVIHRCADTMEQSAAEQAVLAAERVMQSDYHQPLTIADIAKRISVSESSLYSHFAAFRGQTPMASLQAIRLRHALTYLHHSTRKLDTIASLCGYCSASHLTRHVKAATGFAPGKLRAKQVGE